MNQERSGKKGQESLPADLVKNKEALNRLARSGDAQRLMELLRQGGGIQGAAEAAVKGDTSQLVGMMQRLMNTPEGGELVERIRPGQAVGPDRLSPRTGGGKEGLPCGGDGRQAERDPQ